MTAMRSLEKDDHVHQLVLVTVCRFCGAPLDAVPVGAGESWNPAVLWGYIAQQAHACACRRLGEEAQGRRS